MLSRPVRAARRAAPSSGAGTCRRGTAGEKEKPGPRTRSRVLCRNLGSRSVEQNGASQCAIALLRCSNVSWMFCRLPIVNRWTYDSPGATPGRLAWCHPSKPGAGCPCLPSATLATALRPPQPHTPLSHGTGFRTWLVASPLNDRSGGRFESPTHLISTAPLPGAIREYAVGGSQLSRMTSPPG